MLIIVRGIPGSGKTTFVKNQLKGNNKTFSHFEADMYFEKYNTATNKNEYHFDASKLGKAHHWCKEQTRQALTKGDTVYVSNTFTTIKEMTPYVEMAQELNAKLVIIEMSKIPVVEGKRKSIHNVPQDVIDRMLKRWDSELPSCWKHVDYRIC